MPVVSTRLINLHNLYPRIPAHQQSTGLGKPLAVVLTWLWNHDDHPDAACAHGWSARIAHDLIEHRKQAATKAVLTPLENRLTAAFAELTGDSTRQVFLDEHLQIAGIGRTRDTAHAFEQLSQGAKEQLLLCLRLAVAQELATDEPQVLILDDVLVNTDPVRQERILDVLGAQAERLQILILTCHPDRYRGIGQPISLSTTL